MVAFRISSFICHSVSFFSILSGTLNALIHAFFYVVVFVDVWVYVTIKTPSVPSISCSRNFILKLYADEESAVILQLHEDNMSRMCHYKNYFYANYSYSNTHICKIVVVYMYLNYILFLGMYMYLSSLCLINYAEINKYIN